MFAFWSQRDSLFAEFGNTPASLIMQTGLIGAGSRTLSVAFTPTNSTDLNPVTTTVLLTVNKVMPAITWPTPAPIVYGTRDR